jgi:hypothetical protein
MSTETIRRHGFAEFSQWPLGSEQNIRFRIPSTRWFWPLWSFIAVVSVLDAWLVVINLSEMLLVEENWVCRSLIRADPHNLGFFLPAKAAGTAIVLLALRGIVVRLERHGMLITSGVALYQFTLLLYFFR